MRAKLIPNKDILLHLAGALLLGAFFLFLGWSDLFKRQTLWEHQLSSQSNLQRLAVEQSQQSLKRQALIAAQSLSEDIETLALIRRISALASADGLAGAEVATLRGQLARKLSGPWSVLQSAGAVELHIHLSPGAISLLRMHEPSTWGDKLTDTRPLVDRAQREGILVSGMEAGRHGTGMRGIVPIHATNLSSSPVIATLEVGFGMLPELRQLDIDLQSGLALLLNKRNLADVVWDERTAELTLIGDGDWWLERFSRPEISTWLRDGSLNKMAENWQPSTLVIDRRRYLVSHIPVLNEQRDADDADQAMAMILVWRDITPLWQDYQSERRQAMLTWLAAFLAALSLVGGLMLASRENVRRQEKLQQARLRETMRKREQDRALLSIIAHAQSAYINDSNLSDSFDQLLEQILALTGSQFGFVGQVLLDDQRRPYMQTYAISNIAWDADSEAFYQKRLEKGMIFSQLDSLIGQVLQHAIPYISNDPVNDPHRGGLPPGHPALYAYLGLPILFGEELVGMIGLANRPEGYSQQDVDFLLPLLSTLGQMVHALRKDSDERIISLRLDRKRLALRALNEIAALPSQDTANLLTQALELGCQYLQMDFGTVSRVENALYTVIAQHSTEVHFRDGQEFELASTYCALTLQQDEVLAIEFMGQSQYKQHPCYERFKHECYLGIALTANNEPYGTLNFSTLQPRATPFDETELEFVRLMGRWVSGTLGRWSMKQEHSELIDRLSKLAQHLPGMVYQYQQSSDGRSWFPYCSEGLQDLYGVSPAQAGTDASDVINAIHPEDRDSVMRSLEVSAARLTIWREEFRTIHPDKGELWLLGNATPQRLLSGDLIWHGFTTDITARKHMELALGHERMRLASIIVGTNVGTWEWNIQTGEVLLNERWANIVGYRLEELSPVNEVWRNLFHPDDLAVSSQILARHMAGKQEFYDSISRMLHKDGHWVWVKSSGRLISRDEQGNPLWVSGTHVDITREMQRDAEVSEARAFLRAVIDASTEVSVIAIGLDGVITLFNSGAEKLLGYSADEMIGKHSPNLFHLNTELQRRAEQLSEELGHPVSYEDALFANVRQGLPETQHWTYVSKNGGRRLVNLTITSIVDQQCNLTGFLSVATDITDLIETTQALQKSESRFRYMVSNLPGAVYHCRNDRNWTMTYLSEEVSRITGYPASDFVDSNTRTYASIVHPEDLHLTYKAAEQISKHEVFELTYRVIHADGREVRVKEKGRGEFDSVGKLLWLSGFIWDATEQHRIDQLKSQFVSTVSHELRTPVTAISGALGLINGGAMGPLPTHMAGLIGVAHNNSLRLNSLINDLLDMDKLTAGKMSLRMVEQQLTPIVLQTLHDNASYAEQYQVRLLVGTLDAVYVDIDAQRLGQVLTNFLSNAAKFSSPGSQVIVDALLDGNQVKISVTDTGIGIPQAFHHNMFEKFSQVDASNTRHNNGTGLGLAISKELTERMGGEVGFISDPGKGSTFWCLFPATTGI
ncbi:PAS domain-containing protein [Halopseudomonas pelagia]|uniref:histidine kinase n=1 Tax=Halopseudomonas pelagia TaxID=553151 RepID=A0AA91Z743_9GAMM|nr:PAS domain-containing protein [Halopseudomonas pelagia]PCD00517.1 hypothetical protein CO192_04825 [Halopseudomonas pelagia]QFY55220.1 PAS domain S-box protein [Halopseudomonas pelagia]